MKKVCIYAPVVEQTFPKQNTKQVTRRFVINGACCAIHCEGNDDCIVQERKPSSRRCQRPPAEPNSGSVESLQRVDTYIFGSTIIVHARSIIIMWVRKKNDTGVTAYVRRENHGAQLY